MELRVDASEHGDVTVVTLAGDIDLHTAPQLREVLDKLCIDGRRIVVVDLSAVDFLDSSALGTLVAARHSFAHEGGELRVACPQPHAQKIFRITRLAEVVPVFETVQQASA